MQGVVVLSLIVSVTPEYESAPDHAGLQIETGALGADDTMSYIHRLEQMKAQLSAAFILPPGNTRYAFKKELLFG